MFIEPSRSGRKKGWIEVISGCMFSGKTEELIRRLRRVQIAGQHAEIFKPILDIRYDPSDIVSHDSTRIRSTPVENCYNILLLSAGVDVVGIDEAQFFDNGIVDVFDETIDPGLRTGSINEYKFSLSVNCSTTASIIQSESLIFIKSFGKSLIDPTGNDNI